MHGASSCYPPTGKLYILYYPRILYVSAYLYIFENCWPHRIQYVCASVRILICTGWSYALIYTYSRIPDRTEYSMYVYIFGGGVSCGSQSNWCTQQDNLIDIKPCWRETKSEDFSLLVWRFYSCYFFVAFSWLFRGPLLSRKTVFGPFSLLFRGFFVAFPWLFRGPRFGQILRVLALEQSSESTSASIRSSARPTKRRSGSLTHNPSLQVLRASSHNTLRA